MKIVVLVFFILTSAFTKHIGAMNATQISLTEPIMRIGVLLENRNSRMHATLFHIYITRSMRREDIVELIHRRYTFNYSSIAVLLPDERYQISRSLGRHDNLFDYFNSGVWPLKLIIVSIS